MHCIYQKCQAHDRNATLLKYCRRIQLSELLDTRLTAGNIYSCTSSRDALRVSKDTKVKRFHTSQEEEEEKRHCINL